MSRASGILDADVDKSLRQATTTVKCQPGTAERADSEFMFENGVFPARVGTPEHHLGPYGGHQRTSMIVAGIEGLKGEGGHVEKLEMSVMDTIYDAISKEGFVNKLIIPLKDYLEIKILRKLQLLWIRLTLTKIFEGFVRACVSIKHRRQIKDKGCSYWIKTSVGKHFQSWLHYIRGGKELKEKIKKFVQSCTTRRLRLAFRGWRGNYLLKGWKQEQQKRADQVWSFSHLRRAWHGWDQHVVLAKDNNCYAEDFLFRRLASSCFTRWWRYVQLKLLPTKRSLLSMKTLDSRSHQMAFNFWNHKISLSLLVRERVLHFVKHCTGKLQQLILTKWHQLVLRSRHLESVEKILLLKLMVRLKRTAFRELKRHWIEMRVVHRKQTVRLFRARSASFGRWAARIQHLKAVKKRILQLQLRLRFRSQQKLFALWVVFATKSRKFAIAKEANKLAERVKLLESDLDVAKKVRHQLENSILEFENEKTEVRKVAQKAIFRTSVCKAGFLEVDIRWRTPSLEWLPPPCAGHTAVSLPGKHGTYCSRIALFGGYNGENCFNQVFIFDTDEMHWNAPAPSAANGSVIPRAMLTHTACAFGKNQMVIFGGYDGAQEFSDVSVMKISEDGLGCEWSQPQIFGGTKPGPVCQHTACLYEDGPCMVVYGGYRSEVGLLNEVWILDLNRLRWSCPEYLGTPPEPRRGHGAGMVGTKMYIFGGYNGREHLSDLHALDISTMTWESIQGQSQGPSARRQHAVTVVGQHLVVYGGYDGKQYLGDLFSFDTTRKWWKRWPDQETGLAGQRCGRSMHTMVEAGQRLVIFGGVHDWGALQEMIFLENPAGGVRAKEEGSQRLSSSYKETSEGSSHKKVMSVSSSRLLSDSTGLKGTCDEVFRIAIKIDTTYA